MIPRVLTISLAMLILSLTPIRDTCAADDQDLLYSLGYTVRYRLKERFRGFAETIYEQKTGGEFLGTQNEFDLYGGMVYDLKEWFRVEGGLGYYYIHRDEVSDGNEMRLWQSGTLDWPESLGKVRRFVVHHRFRLEERFRHEVDWNFALRFRYRLGFAFPFNRYTVEPGAFFCPFKTEFYVPLGKDIEGFFTQQLRFTVGIGYVFDENWKAELRYAWQQSRDTRDQDLQLSKHFIEFRLSTAIRITDLIKAR